MTDDEVDAKEQGVSIGIGDGTLTLSVEDAIKLSSLSEHPGYQSLRQILKAMNDATTVALRDRKMGIEDLRFQQGIADAAGSIADLLEKELPEWYARHAQEGRANDNA